MGLTLIAMKQLSICLFIYAYSLPHQFYCCYSAVKPWKYKIEKIKRGSKKYNMGGSHKYREVTKSDNWAWQNRSGKKSFCSKTSKMVDYKKNGGRDKKLAA